MMTREHAHGATPIAQENKRVKPDTRLVYPLIAASIFNRNGESKRWLTPRALWKRCLWKRPLALNPGTQPPDIHTRFGPPPDVTVPAKQSLHPQPTEPDLMAQLVLSRNP